MVMYKKCTIFKKNRTSLTLGVRSPVLEGVTQQFLIYFMIEFADIDDKNNSGNFWAKQSSLNSKCTKNRKCPSDGMNSLSALWRYPTEEPTYELMECPTEELPEVSTEDTQLKNQLMNLWNVQRRNYPKYRLKIPNWRTNLWTYGMPNGGTTRSIDWRYPTEEPTYELKAGPLRLLAKLWRLNIARITRYHFGNTLSQQKKIISIPAAPFATQLGEIYPANPGTGRDSSGQVGTGRDRSGTAQGFRPKSVKSCT